MGAFSKLMAVTFATSLAKPFTKWKAFEYELIDENGKIIKKPENPLERAALGGIKDLVRRMKRLLLKVVPDSRLLGVLVAAYLLKKESTLSESEFKIRGILEKELTESELSAMIGYLKNLVNMNINCS